MLKKARRQSSQDIQEGTIDDFMNRMGLGDPDPSNYKTGLTVPMKLSTGSDKINLMIGGNVTKFLMFTKESCGPCGLVKRYITNLKDPRESIIEEVYLEDVSDEPIPEENLALMKRSME